MKTQNAIVSKLNAALKPEHLEVLNESHQHNVPVNSETHFKVTVVSPTFGLLSQVQRHRQIYTLLKDELENGVHALAIHAYTPDEFAKRQNSSPNSPLCEGGSKE